MCDFCKDCNTLYPCEKDRCAAIYLGVCGCAVMEMLGILDEVGWLETNE